MKLTATFSLLLFVLGAVVGCGESTTPVKPNPPKPSADSSQNTYQQDMKQKLIGDKKGG